MLEEPEIRANLPRYSDWPTFPQLFINGELIGGCDITMELYESGDLATHGRRSPKSGMIQLPPLPAEQPRRPGRPGHRRAWRLGRGGLQGRWRRRAQPWCCSASKVPKLNRVYDALKKVGPEPALYPLDMRGADPADYEAMADKIAAELGGLHGLLHCAADFSGLAPLETTDAEEFITRRSTST